MKKTRTVFGTIFIGILIVLAVMLSFSRLGSWHNVAYAAGTPDSYGNAILEVAYYQNTTGSWTNVTSITTAAYTPDVNVQVTADQHTRIRIYVRLNETLASDLSIASSRARILVTITDVVTDTLAVYNSGTAGSGYWLLYFWYPNTVDTWVPDAATNYNVTLNYEAYY